MKISTRGEYGLLALVDLATHAGNGPVQALQIAERQAIPKQYLDQIMLALKNARLVTSARGRSGGYSLARSAESISLFDVITALEGHAEKQSFRGSGAQRKNTARSVLHNLWQELDEYAELILRNKSLAEICQACSSAENLVTYDI
jgi:Rrf2 family protein